MLLDNDKEKGRRSKYAKKKCQGKSNHWNKRKLKKIIWKNQHTRVGKKLLWKQNCEEVYPYQTLKYTIMVQNQIKVVMADE